MNKESKMGVNESKWDGNILLRFGGTGEGMLCGQYFHNPPIPASQGLVCLHSTAPCGKKKK
ncbi:unnamed protein product [Sphenostylis stenocarpa]|uniref:Uncharacterized protein n=1 Tax=Sphenostylis stenocarpa TaxID=92480 RepID=A0AA86STL7_9FABA|nr:unnamed protein product [Sphenostylis stenocarpa]